MKAQRSYFSSYSMKMYVNIVISQAWILRSFRMLSQEESTERFDDNNEDGDDFVSWEEYKANEFEDLEDEDDGETPDASKMEDLQMMEEDKVLFFVS